MAKIDWADAKLAEAAAFRRLADTTEHQAWKLALRDWAKAAERLRQVT